MEDLLFKTELYEQINRSLEEIKKNAQSLIIVGHPTLIEGTRYNSASVFFKRTGFNYITNNIFLIMVFFDEKRYFKAGERQACVFSHKGYQIGLCICEDLWAKQPIIDLREKEAEIVICINASPFEIEKSEKRFNLLKEVTHMGMLPIYVNQVGGQDELIFDGQSLALNKNGTIGAQAPAFKEVCNKSSFIKIVS